MPWCYVGGRFGHFSRAELLDLDIDPDEGRDFERGTDPRDEEGNDD